MHRATVDDLAAAADVSPVTVRHHLNGLMADGLIESDSVRRKVGRRTMSTVLAKKERTVSQNLSGTKLAPAGRDEGTLSGEVVTDLFQGVVQGILDDHIW